MHRQLNDRAEWIAWRDGVGAVFRGDPQLPDHLDVIREIWDEDVYRLDGVDLDGKLVVDLGAHIGAFTVRAALAGAWVLAIEPWADALRWLNVNVELNGVADRVLVVPAAAAVGTWQCAVSGVAGTGMGQIESGTGCRCVDPNEILGIAQSFRPDEDMITVLKVDIEGGEYPLLSTFEADELLARAATIIMETHPGDIGRLIAHLLRTHHVDAFGLPAAGGMLCGKRY